MDLEKNREIDRNRYTISKSRKIFEFFETKSTDIQDGTLEKSRVILALAAHYQKWWYTFINYYFSSIIQFDGDMLTNSLV